MSTKAKAKGFIFLGYNLKIVFDQPYGSQINSSKYVTFHWDIIPSLSHGSCEKKRLRQRMNIQNNTSQKNRLKKYFIYHLLSVHIV